MKHTYKEKIEILRGILIEYSNYFKYFSCVKLYDLGLRFWIIFEDFRPKQIGDGSLTRKIPRYDIDKIIVRYRSKLDYEISKHQKELEIRLNNLSWNYSIMNLK